jgi:DNA-binding MarR family transcriptional regulator
VTLQQVILLNRIVESRAGTLSELAATLGMSLPSISQMIDRLHKLGLLTRTENSADRRKKQIMLTPDGSVVLDRLREARSAEFEAGTARLSPQLRSDLRRVLSRAVQELDTSVENPGAYTTGS